MVIIVNENIIKEIALSLNINEIQIRNTLKLLEDGNTIPFIARYRKEATFGLDEEQIRSINEVYMYQVNLLKRKEDVIRLIDEKGLMTDELRDRIMKASKLVEVEDLYRPYKEKKKTKASDAINNGLEPLAKMIMSFPVSGDFNSLCSRFINDKVKSVDEALKGASYIIAEYISDNASFRKWIRNYIYNNAFLVCKKKKDAVDDDKTYEMYYDYREAIKNIKPHRYLAINRANDEKIISVSFDIDNSYVLTFLKNKIIKNDKSFVCSLVYDSICDSYKRLIEPSIEREIKAELFEKAEDVAIDNFSKNLEKLLLQPPMKDKMVLGLDPAFRTGCKLAVLDPTGKMIDIFKIYPHEPINKYEEAKKITKDVINKYKIDIVAIGNGTASRESEAFIADVIKDIDRKVSYILVSEAGASVYSASKLAISEFPDLHVEERSAISIGRRLQDPLSELVKIDPESIGVGLYQHDVSDKKLRDSLDFVVEKAVNSVGVNINTASFFLLKYVSGLTKASIDKIIKYRESKGKFLSREQIKKSSVMSDKIFEQSIGFLRIFDGNNILDMTSIHPESYPITIKFLSAIGCSVDDIGSDKLISKLSDIDPLDYALKLGCDKYTLEDIIKSLCKPNRDPRDEMDKPLLRSDILHIEDLKPGMKLQGTVRNVVDFGAFVDIGLHNDGLIHISEICDKYIKHPSDVLKVGDIIDCYVLDVFLDKKKVALTMKKK